MNSKTAIIYEKILFFAFALVAGAMSMKAQTSLDTTQVDGIWYILDKTKQNKTKHTATVTYGEEDRTYADRLIIPGGFYTQDENYNYYEFTVTAIGDSAFANCPTLTGITIPKTVRTLGLNLLSRSPNVTELKMTLPHEVPLLFLRQFRLYTE